MATSLAPPPLQTPLIESIKQPVITKVWGSWLRALVDRAQVAAYAVLAITLSGQSASIGLTSLIPAASGLYRITYRFRVVTPAGVSSSLQLVITSIDGGITCTNSVAAYTGNVANAPQTGSFLVRCDPASPLTYSTVYASNPAAAMLYDLQLVAESL